MHFVYKMDNLFRSIRVSDENSSVTWAFHFFKLITTPDFFAFNMNHSKPRHKLSTLSDIICYFSFIYRFVLTAKWQWNWKALQNELWKGWNLAWLSSFHPHGMCKKVERVTTKTGCTSWTNWTISFKVSGFWTKKHICYNGTSFF